MNEATWYTQEKKFTRDYVCMDGKGRKKVVGEAYMTGEVIMGQRKKNGQKKRCLKAYDRVNMKKLIEEMRSYGVHQNLVRLIERIYYGSMVKIELDNVTTGWCKSDSGVRQGGLSPVTSPF